MRWLRARRRRLHDWTIEGVHLCMTRLNLLRLNTMPALDEKFSRTSRRLEALQRRTARTGRLPFPMLRERRSSLSHFIGMMRTRASRIEFARVIRAALHFSSPRAA